jgi:hypothetical protein
MMHKKLQILILEDCAIVRNLATRRCNEGPDSSHYIKLGKVQLYEVQWAQWFEKLKELPDLRNFQIGSSRIRLPGERGPRFLSEINEGPPYAMPSDRFMYGLFPDRYLTMAEGRVECPWILRYYTPSQPGYPAFDGSDRNALRSFLRKIDQSVKEDVDSNHAGRVRELIGHVEPRADGSGGPIEPEVWGWDGIRGWDGIGARQGCSFV